MTQFDKTKESILFLKVSGHEIRQILTQVDPFHHAFPFCLYWKTQMYILLINIYTNKFIPIKYTIIFI